MNRIKHTFCQAFLTFREKKKDKKVKKRVFKKFKQTLDVSRMQHSQIDL